MEKIIVTTDLSANSRSAMRFAIQVAAQRNAAVVFLHIHQVLRASFWTDEQYAGYVEHHRKNVLQELAPMVRAIYRSMNRSPFNYELAVHHNLDITEGILEFVESSKASLICISTRGAGALRKLFGTHTTALLDQSPIPVACVPARQRIYPISDIVYASDMKDYLPELRQLVTLAKPMQARLTLVHIAYGYEFRPELSMMEATLQKQLDYPVQVTYCERNMDKGLAEDIQAKIMPTKHAVLALFSDQGQGILQQLLVPGNARELAASAKQIFISFPKQKAQQQQPAKQKSKQGHH